MYISSPFTRLLTKEFVLDAQRIFFNIFLSFSSSCFICVWMLYKLKVRVWCVKLAQAVKSGFLPSKANLQTRGMDRLFLVAMPSSSWHPHRHRQMNSEKECCYNNTVQLHRNRGHFQNRHVGGHNRTFTQRCAFVHPHWSTCKNAWWL